MVESKTKLLLSREKRDIIRKSKELVQVECGYCKKEIDKKETYYKMNIQKHNETKLEHIIVDDYFCRKCYEEICRLR